MTGPSPELRRGLLAAALAVLALPLAGPTAGAEPLRLLMLDQPGCEWCEAWERDVGGVYARTEEGRQAPLMRARIHAPPAAVELARPARYTPTFVLLDGDREVGRIEGYPGEDFFWGLLQRLLQSADGQRPREDAAGNAAGAAGG